MKQNGLIFIVLFLMLPAAFADKGEYCAQEGQFCQFDGKAVVTYGGKGKYSKGIFRNGVLCSNSVFGDPAPNVSKKCFVKRETPVGPEGSRFCAKEGGFCSFKGEAKVWYGAKGRWNYKSATGAIGCNNTVFGDAAPGMVKSCFYTPVNISQRGPKGSRFCASEGGSCIVETKSDVWYGAQDKWAHLIVIGGVDCNNATFSDPAPGVPKNCYAKPKRPKAPHKPEGSEFCANEGEYCSVGGDARVWFGAKGHWVTQLVSRVVACDTATFGDPKPGAPKKCFYKPVPIQGPSGTTFCANEGQYCSFNGDAKVYYGGGGRWNTIIASGSIACNNATFGDAWPGQAKQCFFEPIMPVGPEGARYCAPEGQYCSFDGFGKVYYGINGRWNTKKARNGVDCNSSEFGDAVPGQMKHCFVMLMSDRSSWVPARNGHIPANAFIGGHEQNQAEKLYVCLAEYRGGLYPGKASRGIGGCHIAWGNNEVNLKNYKVLVDADLYGWKKARNGKAPSNAVLVGHDYERHNKHIYACRGSFNGGVHMGKFVRGNSYCQIGWGGRSHKLRDFEVMTN